MKKVKKGLVYITSSKSSFIANPKCNAWGGDSSPELKTMGAVDVNVPVRAELTLRDCGKLDKVITTMRSNLARTKQGNSERIKYLANTIERVQKMTDTALDGEGLRETVIDELWNLYAKIETMGKDDAHYFEDLPCNEYQSLKPNAKRGAQGVIFHNGRRGADSRPFKPSERWKRIIPDSIYPDPEDQWALLSVTDKIQRGELARCQIDWGLFKPSKARKVGTGKRASATYALSERTDVSPEYATKAIPNTDKMGDVIRHQRDKVTIGYPIAEIDILPPYESKAAKRKRIKSARDALIRLASERKEEAAVVAYRENERRTEAHTKRDNVILYAREIVSTVAHF